MSRTPRAPSTRLPPADSAAAGQVMHHPREVQEAAAVKELQRRFPASVANVSGPKPVQKKVPVHGPSFFVVVVVVFPVSLGLVVSWWF